MVLLLLPNLCLLYRDEQQIIKEAKHVVGGLMDGTDHYLAIASNVAQRLNHEERSCTVQPRRGLVQAKHQRLCQYLHANTQPPPLPTAYPSQVPVPDRGVSTFLESHLCHRVLDHLVQLSLCHPRQPQSSTEAERFLHRDEGASDLPPTAADQLDLPRHGNFRRQPPCSRKITQLAFQQSIEEHNETFPSHCISLTAVTYQPRHRGRWISRSQKAP